MACFVCINIATAQTVTLNITQNYTLPETPVITQSSDTLKSSVPIGNQWYLGGEKIEGEINQSLIITGSGNYMVVFIDSVSGCSSYSEPISAIKTEISILQMKGFRCVVYPNPNNGFFTVEIESDKMEPIALDLLTINGRSVAKKEIKHIPGKQNYQFGKSNLVDGVYTLRIKFGSQITSQRIIVHK
jgi:hypothetical protein